MLKRIIRSINYRWQHKVLPLIRHQTAGVDEANRLLFVFHGRVGQWYGEGQQLYQTEPVFKDTIQRFSRTSEEYIGIEVKTFFDNTSKGESASNDQLKSFIAHGALQMGLFDLWQSRGVYPDAVVGMSQGEVSAAYAAGLSFEDAVHIFCNLIEFKPETTATGKLFKVDVNSTVVREICRANKVRAHLIYEGGGAGAYFAIEPNECEVFETVLRDNQITSEAFPNPYKTLYHTSQVEEYRQSILLRFERIKAFTPKCSFYSSAYGGLMARDETIDFNYFYQMLRRPVLIGAALTEAIKDGCDVFLNIGSRTRFDQTIKSCASDSKRKHIVLDSMRKNEVTSQVFESSLKRLKKIRFARSSVNASAPPHYVTGADFISPANASALNLDIFAFEVRQNPFPYYAALRRQGSVHFMEKNRIWLVLDYDDVAFAFKQSQIFSSAIQRDCDAVLLAAEPLEHKRVRRFVMPFFSNEVITETAKYAEKAAESLLDQALQKTEFDIVGDFAKPLSERVMGHLIGLEPDEITVATKLRGVYKEGLNMYEQYFAVLREHFDGLLSQTSKKPGDKLYGKLLQASRDGDFTRQKIVSLLSLFWAAGTRTSATLISASILLLLKHPHITRELKNDLRLIPQFVEESMRFDAPEQAIRRTVVSDVELSGVRIPAGAEVHLCIGAANRDPKHYDNPDELDLYRNQKNNLVFGAGAHYCLGAGLSRMEARVALETCLKRPLTLRPAQNLNQVLYDPLTHLRAFDKLMVTIK